MPLFMDLHSNKSGEFSIEALIEKHKADLRVQQKYGVQFKKVWVNEDQGLVFCLMEGPDRQACENVHQEAHGDTGCNIVSVKPREHDVFLSGSLADENDFAVIPGGHIDSGYRTLLHIGFFDASSGNQPELDLITKVSRNLRGDVIIEPDRSVNAVFVRAIDALTCAVTLQKSLNTSTSRRDFRIAVVSGNPVHENHDRFYGYALELSSNLLISGQAATIRSTQLTFDLANKEIGDDDADTKSVEKVSAGDEEFINRLMNCIRHNLADPEFNANSIGKKIGLSRSQLFRRVKLVTSYTPNSLIQEYRLYTAIKQLQTGHHQIAQIAFDTGFSSPSFFTKVFSKRFNILPSHINRIGSPLEST